MSDVKIRARAAHRNAVEWSLEHVVASLRDQLGAKLVAHMTDVDPKTVNAWARGPQRPRDESEQRLRLAFQVFQLLQSEDDAHTVRAWFVGLNPQLDDQAPATAVRDGRLQDVWVAAQAYCAGG